MTAEAVHSALRCEDMRAACCDPIFVPAAAVHEGFNEDHFQIFTADTVLLKVGFETVVVAPCDNRWLSPRSVGISTAPQQIPG